MPDASSNAYSWFREESNLPRSPDRAAVLNYADGGHILEHGVSSVLVTQPLSGENKAPIWGLVASRECSFFYPRSALALVGWWECSLCF